jgi:hypothetical protein
LFGLTPANEISFVDCVNEDGEQVLHRPIEITPFSGAILLKRISR